MNKGTDYTKARADAQDKADRHGLPYVLHLYNGVWWVETRKNFTTTIPDGAEIVEPRTGNREHMRQLAELQLAHADALVDYVDARSVWASHSDGWQKASAWDHCETCRARLDDARRALATALGIDVRGHTT